MARKYWILFIAGHVGTVFLIVLALLPLSLLFVSDIYSSPSIEASETIQAHITGPQEISSDYYNKEAYYLSEKVADIPPADKVVFDLFTVNERLERNLPTALLEIDPYYADKTVYLTFDDGPSFENTPAVLDILKQQNIKATFFVVGTQAEKNPELIKRIYHEGHAIGNHSYNHVYRELYQSPNSYIEQLHHTDAILKRIIQVRPRISRAPGGSAGSFTQEYWKILKSEGYTEVGWNISSGDASKANAEQIIGNVTSQFYKNKYLWNHSIVLMHDGINHAETVKALPNIIKLYKDNGFTFRPVNLQTPPAW